jgi:hypothetical protein
LIRNANLLANRAVDSLANRHATGLANRNHFALGFAAIGANLLANRNAFLHQLLLADRDAFGVAIGNPALLGLGSAGWGTAIAAGVARVTAALVAKPLQKARTGGNFSAFPVAATNRLVHHFGNSLPGPLGHHFGPLFDNRNLANPGSGFVDHFGDLLVLGHLLLNDFRHRLILVSGVSFLGGD